MRNEKLEKKYESIKNFISKNKEVIFEDGCLNSSILNMTYIDKELFSEKEDTIRFNLSNGCQVEVTSPRQVAIDRKYKSVYLTKYFRSC